MNKNSSSEMPYEFHKKYMDLLDSLNIGYVLLDMDFGILDVNEPFLNMSRARREDVVGHNSREFYTPEEFAVFYAMDQQLVSSGWYKYEFVLPHIPDDGKRIPVLFSVSIVFDENGEPQYTHSLVTDISQLKEVQGDLEKANEALVASQNALENEMNMLETILYGLEDSVTVLDTAGTIILSNPLGKEIQSQRIAPDFPLKLGEQTRLQLRLGSETRNFVGQRKQILNNEGHEYACVETLRDVTDQIMLRERESELIRIRRKIKYEEISSKIIGVSRAIEDVFDVILRCAETDSTILLLGETGVGKELAARAIHDKSARKDRPFVAVNCGALPDTLLESELFGHVKGAFTGAISERLGLFREAEGGALFLDEVGDLSGPLQVKLLRALQEKVIRPVGEDRSYSVDVRIIAATNRNLRELVAEGVYREDLYYRIAVIPFPIPPLRERKEDILMLADHFLRKHSKSEKADAKRLDAAAQQLLVEHSWPGNVRELENAIEYALVMSPGSVITADAFPLQSMQISRPETERIQAEAGQRLVTGDFSLQGRVDRPQAEAPQPTLSNRSQEFEKQTIIEALKRSAGNKSAAARDLGISRVTISRKIKKYGIT